MSRRWQAKWFAFDFGCEMLMSIRSSFTTDGRIPERSTETDR